MLVFLFNFTSFIPLKQAIFFQNYIKITKKLNGGAQIFQKLLKSTFFYDNIMFQLCLLRLYVT